MGIGSGRVVKWVLAIGGILGVVMVLVVRWQMNGFIDDKTWANQTEYMVENNPLMFDYTVGYGHPGTTIVLGTSAIHFLGFSYISSVYIFMTLACAGLILLAVWLCYVMRPKEPWWLAAGAILSLEGYYSYATPPSIIASLLVVILFLLTLRIVTAEKRVVSNIAFLWGMFAGLIISTRFDVGVATSAATLLIILYRLSWRKMLFCIAIAAAIFYATNPFMWISPIGQVRDLLWEMGYHYKSFPYQSPLIWNDLLSFSLFALVALILGLILLVFERREKKSFFSRSILGLIGLTAAVYGVVLTSKYQSLRYLLPITLTWQVLLPVFIFSLVSRIPGMGSITKTKINGIVAVIIELIWGYFIFVRLYGFLIWL